MAVLSTAASAIPAAGSAAVAEAAALAAAAAQVGAEAAAGNAAASEANMAGAIAVSVANRVPQTSTTGSAQLPAGTTAQRDAVPVDGMFRYNATNGAFEGFAAGAWGAVGGGGGAVGGGSDAVFYENDQVITTNYTLTAGKHAHSVGPVTINTGVTVTIPTGANWVIS